MGKKNQTILILLFSRFFLPEMVPEIKAIPEVSRGYTMEV